MRDTSRLGIVELSSSATEDRHQCHGKYDDTYPTLPLCDTAPKEQGAWQRLYILKDRSSRSRKARDRLEESIKSIICRSIHEEGKHPDKREQDPS